MSASVLFDAPGPKGRRNNTIYSVVAVMVLLGLAALLVWKLEDQFTPEKWTFLLDPMSWEFYFLPGIIGTLQAAGIAVVCAGVLGIVLGLGRLADNVVLRKVSGVVVEFFRAVPVLVMMFFAYAVLARFSPLSGTALTLTAVVVGLTLYNSAVIAELIRSGVGSLPKGQHEAGLAIGLTPSQTRNIVLVPQAITAMLPSLVAQLVVVLKDTALGQWIAYPELLRAANQLGSGGNSIPVLFVAAVLFIVINVAISALARKLEQRMRRQMNVKAVETADVEA